MKRIILLLTLVFFSNVSIADKGIAFPVSKLSIHSKLVKRSGSADSYACAKKLLTRKFHFALTKTFSNPSGPQELGRPITTIKNKAGKDIDCFAFYFHPFRKNEKVVSFSKEIKGGKYTIKRFAFHIKAGEGTSLSDGRYTVGVIAARNKKTGDKYFYIRCAVLHAREGKEAKSCPSIFKGDGVADLKKSFKLNKKQLKRLIPKSKKDKSKNKKKSKKKLKMVKLPKYKVNIKVRCRLRNPKKYALCKAVEYIGKIIK